jgi:MFS transporter, DHA2 family, multidrug resistance protein
MHKWIVAVTLMLPTIIVLVDTSVVNVSLDHIRGSLSAGIDESTWTITSYLASNAIVIPMTGWLSRFFGRKRYFIFSIGLFTLSSLMCGLSWNIQSLVFFRIFQGVGGAALQPTSQSILLETFPPQQHGMAMAIFGIGIMLGPVIGPLLGGWITDSWSWHWVFFINVPIGILSIFLSSVVLRDPPYMTRKRTDVDYWGLLFLTLGFGGLQIVLDQGQREDWLSSNFIVWLSFVSVSSIILFIIVELFAKSPVVDLRAFRNRSFLSGNAIMFFMYFSLLASTVLLPLYVQTLMGYTSLLAGWTLAPAGITSMIAMPIAAKLIRRVNPKAILAFGIVLTAYSIHLMARFNLFADFGTIIWPRVVMGVGLGFLWIPLTTLTLSMINKEKMGNATGIFNLVRNLGGSFGVAVVTTLLARRTQFHQSRMIDHLTSLDIGLQLNVSQISQILQEKGYATLSDQGALSLIYDKLLKEASVLSFNDAFHFLFIIMAGMLVLIPLMRRGHASSANEE